MHEPRQIHYKILHSPIHNDNLPHINHIGAMKNSIFFHDPHCPHAFLAN